MRKLLLVPVVFLVAGLTAAQEPTRVAVVSPVRKMLPRVVTQPGAVHPHEETQLYARVAGFVDEVKADIGQRVKAGDVLATLDVPEQVQEAKAKAALVTRHEAEANQARKALAASKANAAAVASNIAEAEAGLTRTDAARQRWASENDRIARLVNQGILDRQTADETLNQYRASQAAHQEATARIASARSLATKADADVAKAEADVEAAVAQVAVAKAESARAEALVGYLKIVAPYDGVVTRRRVSRGDHVQPPAGKGEALFAVAKLDPVRIVVMVPEADAALVAEKTPVELTIPALKGPPLKDAVTRTSWSLEPGARTLRVEVERPNPDERLRPGMFVSATLTAALPQAWTLPATAVVKQGDDRVCFVVQGDKAVRTVVQVGATDGKAVEVFRLGMAEPTGQEKVAAVAAGLTDGARVTVDR